MLSPVLVTGSRSTLGHRPMKAMLHGKICTIVGPFLLIKPKIQQLISEEAMGIGQISASDAEKLPNKTAEIGAERGQYVVGIDVFPSTALSQQAAEAVAT